MNASNPDSTPVCKSPAPLSAPPLSTSDVNENTSSKSPRLLSPAGISPAENSLPIIVTSMPFSPVSTQANIVNFAHGINLTISNGTIPVMSGPVMSVGVATSPSAIMLGNQTSAQLKVPNPNTIQIRPHQMIMPHGTTMGGNSIAVAMANRLSLPFQATPAQLSATTIGNFRPLPPGSTANVANSILSSQIHFQAMQHLRGTPLSLAGVPQAQTGQVQSAASQPMAIRSAAFPVLLNRPVTFAGRPHMITAQPTRLAPRHLGPQVALQVSGQQSVAGGAIMPLFRPTSVGKNITIATTQVVTNPAHTSQNQTPVSQQQLLNQVVASANMQGMTHISLRPVVPMTKVLEQKMSDARMLTGIPVSRFLRPQNFGPVAITTISSPLISGDHSSALVTHGIGVTNASLMCSTSQPNIAALTPEKKKIEHFLGEKQVEHFLGDPPARFSLPTCLPSLSQDSVPVSTPSLSQDSVPVSTPSLSQDSVPVSTPSLSQDSVPVVKPSIVQLPLVAKSPVRDGSKSGEEKREEGTDSTESKFDALKAMEWSSEGIATLPGSNLKLKMNEFGMVEMVTDDIPARPVKTVVDSGVGVNTTDFAFIGSGVSDKDSGGAPVRTSAPTPAPPPPVKEPVKKCENCGKYGFLKDFCKTGRFCSQACVGAYAGRKNKHSPGTHSLLSHKPMFHLKKKKKTFGEGNAASISTTPLPPGADGETSADKDRLVIVTSQSRKTKNFDWQAYLEEQKAVAAHARLFKDPFPSQKNGFKPGMKLEGIDPKHQNLFCILSIAEVQGHRLRLHFDGYSECYDFWCNADSPFIFPVGWCEKNNKPLQPPKHVPRQNFCWASYLRTTKSVAAPKSVFLNPPSGQIVTPSAFRVWMKLEAVDRKNTVLICVATVADVLGDKILIHFDGWDDLYDYWCDIASPFIHPVGWCQENGHTLSTPCDWPEEEIDTFTWDEYLAQTKSQGVPARAFKPRAPVAFEPGMKLEAVDRRNPIQVRVATIKEVKDHQVLIHFDGWDDIFDYWVDDDSPEIKPPGWCARTGNCNLQPPPVAGENNGEGNCPTPCCNGVGHVKGAKYTGHHSSFGCPYAEQNMNKESTLMDRLGSTRVEEGTAAPLAARIKSESGEVRRCPHPGCDSSGHITGKFTSHHRLSGCPLYEKNIQRMNAELQAKPPIKPGRGRKRKHFSTSEVDSKEGILAVASLSKLSRERADQSSFFQNVHQSVFMSNAPDIPVQEGPAFWDYQAKLLPGVMEKLGEEVKGWGRDQVGRFVGSLPGCQVFEKTFRDQEMDGESFLMLSQADIVNVMNIKLGPALKIYNSILLFKQTTDS